MLASCRTHTTLPVLDRARARAFYAEKLGLTPSEETEQAIVYDGGSGRFILFPTGNPARGGHTQMGFTVKDIEATVTGLQARGVVFEQYDFPGFKTENGIARTGPNRAAWFKDSEGNLLGLIQFGT